MRLALFLFGFLFVTPQVSALTAPPTPFTIGAYPQEIFASVETQLSSVTGSGGGGNCSAENERAFAADTLRHIFFDIIGSRIEPQKDIARSACFQNDVIEMEKYLRALVDSYLSSAESCDAAAVSAYESAIEYVWGHLFDLRAYGLDPQTQAPAFGTGADTIGSGPSTHLCPYESVYAQPGYGGVGCRGIVASTVTDSQLSREVSLTEGIAQSLGTIGAGQLPAIRRQLKSIWNRTEAFVRNAGLFRTLGKSVYSNFEPELQTGIPILSAGESGCLGWPTVSAAGVVTGEGISLQNYMPLILSKELADAFDFLLVKDDPRWQEYVLSMRKDAEAENALSLFITQGDDIADINSDHLSLESFSILTIRDQQRTMNDIANNLHVSTRDFARQAIHFPSDSTSSSLPPLRSFARKYATFLSRMCVNRGCESNLLRTVELSLRDECFSSFLMDQFFRQNPNASTLPACRAFYVE